MSVYLPFGTVPFLYINGLQISNNATTPNSIIDIAVGQCRDFSNTFQMQLLTSITVSSAFNGIGGLDTGTVAASTLYNVFLISDPVSGQETSAMISASSVPLMPFGYSAYRLIGHVATDGSSNFLKGYWYGENSSRLFMYDAPQATTITAGNATSYTGVALTKFVPAVSSLPVWIASAFTPGAASRILSMQPGSATGDAVKITGQVTSVVVTSNSLVMQSLVASVPTINYKVSNAGDAVAINVAGYQFTI